MMRTKHRVTSANERVMMAPRIIILDWMTLVYSWDQRSDYQSFVAHSKQSPWLPTTALTFTSPTNRPLLIARPDKTWLAINYLTRIRWGWKRSTMRRKAYTERMISAYLRWITLVRWTDKAKNCAFACACALPSGMWFAYFCDYFSTILIQGFSVGDVPFPYQTLYWYTCLNLI